MFLSNVCGAPSAAISTGGFQYTLHASFQVPYFKTKVPLEITMDKTNRREFVNYWHGMDTYTYRFDTGKLYAIFPRIDTPVRPFKSIRKVFVFPRTFQRNHPSFFEAPKNHLSVFVYSAPETCLTVVFLASLLLIGLVSTV